MSDLFKFAAAKNEETATGIFDTEAQFEKIKNGATEGLKKTFPIEGEKHHLILNNSWVNDNADPEDYAKQKKVKLKDGTFGIPVYGDVSLVDAKTGKEVDRVKQVKLMDLPKMTSRGTFIVKGNEWNLPTQFRLKPGVYTINQANGIPKTQINLAKGGRGKKLEVHMSPVSGEVTMQVENSIIPLYPTLKALGITDEQIEEAWGGELFEINKAKFKGKEDLNIKKFAQKWLGQDLDADGSASAIQEQFKETELSNETTALTMRKPYAIMDEKMLLDASRKLINVQTGKEEVDDRDHLRFKSAHSVDDFFRERLEKNQRAITFRLKRSIDTKEKVREVLAVPAIKKMVEGLFTQMTLSERSEQHNPIHIINEQFKTTLMGEGALGNLQMVKEDARMLHPSHLGILDPVKTPESSKIGVINYLALGAQKRGNDLLSLYVDHKNRKPVRLPPIKSHELKIAFPDQFTVEKGNKVVWIGKKIKVQHKGKVELVSPSEVDLVLPSSQSMFTFATAMIPFLDSTQGGRSFLASKHSEQTVSLLDPEIPQVMSSFSGGKTIEDSVGDSFAAMSPVAGKVTKVASDYVTVKGTDGETHKVNLYNHFKLNDKSFFHHTPVVKVGDKVEENDLIADLNFTKNGKLALGRNASIAYMAGSGATLEDGIIVSDSFAQKMSHQQMHEERSAKGDQYVYDKEQFGVQFPGKITKEQAEKLDPKGIIKKGQKVEHGDIIYATMRKSQDTSEDRILRKLGKGLVRPLKENVTRWEKHAPGIVTDVTETGRAHKVHIKAVKPMEVGDKISGRYGNKGIISEVRPDGEMPIVKRTGKPVEIILNPIGVVGRTNPSQILETVVSRVAEKTGKPIYIENFKRTDNHAEVLKLLKKHKLSDTEELIDPKTDRSFGEITQGNQYILKLVKTSDTGFSARSTGAGYDLNQQPITGGEEGSKSLDALSNWSLVAHGTKNLLREMATHKGERSDEFWRAVQLGHMLPGPKVPFTWDKFKAMLQVAGVNIEKKGSLQILNPTSDDEIRAISAGEITDPKMLRGKGLKEHKGGLFDPEITGGVKGNSWCFDYNTKVITDTGLIKIGEIVTKKLDVKVLSYNVELQRFEYRKILNHWKNTNYDNLVEVDFPKNGGLSGYGERSWQLGKMKCTPNHEIYTGDRYGLRKAYAKDMDGKPGFIATHSLTDVQEQLVFGSLLGDSYTQKNPKSTSFRCTHGIAQEKYLRLKAEILADLVASVKISTISDDFGTRDRIVLRTNSHKGFEDIYQIVYTDGKKKVTQEWLDSIGEIGLCFWYLDDGCLNIHKTKNKISILLCTQGFSKDETFLIKNWLSNSWGISSNINRDEPKYAGKAYGYHLNINHTNSCVFLQMIAKFIPRCMEYKGKIKYKTKTCKICDTRIPLKFGDYCDTCVIKSIKDSTHGREYNKSDSKLLDESSIRLRFGSFFRATELSEEEADEICLSRLMNTFDYIGSILSTSEHVYSNQTIKKTLTSQKLSVVPTDCNPSFVYNIEVEGNHNYFANGLLVGNSHISLPEEIPHPIFKDPIKKLGGITDTEFKHIVGGDAYVGVNGQIISDPHKAYADDLLLATGLTPDKLKIKSGDSEEKKREKILNKALDPKFDSFATGGPGIKNLLSSVNLDEKEQEFEDLVKRKKGSEKNSAHRGLRYVKALKKQNRNPAEAYMTKLIAVLPPQFRPIYQLESGDMGVAEVNYLYRDVGLVANQLKEASDLGDELKKDLRKSMYQGYEALVGVSGARALTRPAKGIIATLTGDSPKTGYFQSKMLRKQQDLAARGVIVPDPTLGIDEVAIPKKMAKQLFKPFTMNKLIKRFGLTAVEAHNRLRKEKDDLVDKALLEAMQERPIILNRAPSLHKYALQAFNAKIAPGMAIKIPNMVVKGYNADFDGDSLIGQVLMNISLDKEDISWYNSYSNNKNFTDKENQEMPHIGNIPSFRTIDLKDFPRVNETMKIKNNKVVEYDVPKGVFVPSIDLYGNWKMQKVSKYSVHTECEEWEIRTLNGRKLLVSSGHSVCALNIETMDIEKTTAEKSIGLGLPVLGGMDNVTRKPYAFGEGLDDHSGWFTEKYSKRKGPTPWGTNNLIPYVEESFDIGWFFGAFLGDGWTSGNVTYLAFGKNGEAVAEKWVEIASIINPDSKITSRDLPHTFEGKEYTSKRINTPGIQLTRFIEDVCEKHTAHTKVMPEDCLVRSLEFRRGLF